MQLINLAQYLQKSGSS